MIGVWYVEVPLHHACKQLGSYLLLFEVESHFFSSLLAQTKIYQLLEYRSVGVPLHLMDRINGAVKESILVGYVNSGGNAQDRKHVKIHQ